MGLLTYISYATIIAAFGFVTLSLASGLLYVSELIEEHSRAAKLYGQRGIYTIVVLHIVLYFSESLPLPQTAFSLICHVVYLQNFSASWPLISLTSVSFLASCIFVISDHFMWFFYFSQKTQEARHRRTYRGPPPEVHSFTEIASFFGICVWLAPLFLFLSLSANDNALPVSAVEPGSPASGTPTTQYAQTRISLFRSLFSSNSLPQIRRSTKQTGDLLVPPMQPSPRASHYLPPQPRSFAEGISSPAQDFTLRSSPQRTVRYTSNPGSAIGLELRKTSSSSVVNKDS